MYVSWTVWIELHGDGLCSTLYSRIQLYAEFCNLSLSLSRYVLQAVLLENYRDIFKFVGFIGNFFWKMNLILNNLEYDRENRY